jgi:hypothetical protein
MGTDRERAYHDAHRHPAQNLDAGFRSRWGVNSVGIPPRNVDRPHPDRSDRADRPDARREREERTIDLTPLMRLAQEACWSRLLNHPRPRPADL